MGVWVFEIDEAEWMKKGRDSDQGTTITLINALGKERMTTFTNKVYMNELEC